MSLELCILASGSAGNASLLRAPTGILLIDAGIGPRTCSRRLDGTGVRLEEIRGICFTHLDRDHCAATWARTVAQLRIRAFVSAGRCREIIDRWTNPGEAADPAPALFDIHEFDSRPFEPLPGVRFHPISLAHDADGSHGFLIEGFGCRIGYATDLGHVPASLLDRFDNLDVLALESNYDPAMQEASGRPFFLKQRIMGGRGHLSNQQAYTAIRQICNRAEARCQPLPAHIVLLHRSRQCNCPSLLRTLFATDLRLASRITLAEQYQRSNWLRRREVAPARGEQLVMAWS